MRDWEASHQKPALGIVRALRGLADDYFFKPDSIKIIPCDLTTDITYKDKW